MRHRHELVGQMYTVTFEEVAVTVAQDLFEILIETFAMFFVNSVTISQSSDAGDAESEMLNLVYHRGTTSGSGGSVGTVVPMSEGNTARLTAEVNNTTQSTKGTVLRVENFNVLLGYLWEPPREQRIVVPMGGFTAGRLVISISAPNDSVTLSGSMTLEEISGV